MTPKGSLRERQTDSRWVPWLIIVAAATCGVALRLQHWGDVRSRGPDERLYNYNAQQVAAGGLTALRSWFVQYSEDKTFWQDPPPTRVGYVAVSAAVMRITGIYDFRAGAAVSLACSIASLALLACIGVRFFNPWVAATAVSFMAVSLVELAMARRAWIDDYFGFVALGILYVGLEILRAPQRLWLYPIFAATGALAVLSKEIAIFPYGIVGLWLFAATIRERRWKGSTALVFGVAASAAATVLVWAASAGSWTLPFVDLRDLNPANEWAQMNTSGPWRQFFYVLWLVGPFTAAMAAAGLAAIATPAVVRQRLGIPEGELAEGAVSSARLAGAALMGVVLFISFEGNIQSMRMISPVNAGYCLMAGLGLWSVLSIARRHLSRIDFRLLAGIALLALVLEGERNYMTFNQVIIRTGMEDLAAPWIRAFSDR